jgi:hypothetical protein
VCALLGVTGAVIVAAFAQTPPASAAPLSIAIVGNHFVNGAGQSIRLLGVDRTSSEYGCVDGFGYNDGHMDDADAAAIASWNADAVRVPLNEDCWLGINGQPNSNEGAEPELTMAGYRQSIENYVADLNAHGLYAILDLHWSAPGTQVALEQQPMPDAHSVPFWESVASTFKNDPAVVFDVFNEPFSPADERSGEDPAHPVSWECWEKGGCPLRAYDPEGNLTTNYTAVGMQTLVDAIRATGATQPLMVGGLNFSNDLSGWIVLTAPEIAGEGCSAYYLIGDYGYTPAAPNGTNLRDHLLTLPPGGLTVAPSSAPPASNPPAGPGSGDGKQRPSNTLTTFHAQVEPGGAAVAFELRAAQSCKGSLSGQTTKAFAVGSKGSKRRKVSLGTVNFKLVAGKAKSVVLGLSGSARGLLKSKGALAVRFTLTLSASKTRTVLYRTATLKEPVSHRHSA